MIAPRLALFAYASQREQLDSVLSEEDVELLTSATGAGEARSGETIRTCINAMVLRTAIQDDLVAWQAAQGGDGSESDGPPQGLLQRLERDVTAYHVIAEQLQKQQDMALVAGLQEFADELRHSKQKLFSTYLQLAAARRNVTAPSPGHDAGGEDQDAALKRLLEECSAADEAVVSVQEGHESTDQLCLDALNKIHGKDQTPVVTLVQEMGAEDLKREKSRIKSMLTVTAVLLTAVVIVYGTILVSTPADIHVPLTSVPGRLRPSRAVSIGSMMYAQVDRWTWNRLPEGQRLAQVNELGQAAAARGFSTVYLTDENDVDLAHWTKTDGAKLLDPVRQRPGGRAAATRP